MVALTPWQLDIIQEFINIGIGKAAGILNQMSRIHVVLEVPDITITHSQDLISHFEPRVHDRCSAVTLAFQGNFSGTAALVFPPESALNLVSIILGSEDMGLDMDSLRIGTLQEVGNIVSGACFHAIARFLNLHFHHSVPSAVSDISGAILGSTLAEIGQRADDALSDRA